MEGVPLSPAHTQPGKTRDEMPLLVSVFKLQGVVLSPVDGA